MSSVTRRRRFDLSSLLCSPLPSSDLPVPLVSMLSGSNQPLPLPQPNPNPLPQLHLPSHRSLSLPRRLLSPLRIGNPPSRELPPLVQVHQRRGPRFFPPIQTPPSPPTSPSLLRRPKPTLGGIELALRREWATEIDRGLRLRGRDQFQRNHPFRSRGSQLVTRFLSNDPTTRRVPARQSSPQHPHFRQQDHPRKLLPSYRSVTRMRGERRWCLWTARKERGWWWRS